MVSGVAAIAYGILVLIGGIAGYAKAKSQVSLISGSISGVLLLIAGIWQLSGNSGGNFLALVVTAVLIVVFALRLVKTRKFMPAGLVLIAGVVTLVLILIDSFGATF